MGKNQSASNLTNIIKQDASGNITFVSGSTTLMSVSSSGAITTTGNVAGTASYASNAELLDGLDSTVFATTGSNTFRGSQYISSSFVPTNFTDTASLYTDGGLRATRNSYFSSSIYIGGDLIVFGTQSVNYITSSQLNIADNIITVNTSTPAVRFGGIAVQDSGSLATGLTGSLLWDSQNNHWIYSNPSGSSYSGGMLISGPRNTGSMGDEQGTTLNAIMKGMGGDHITSSGIFESGSNVGIGVSTPSSIGTSYTTLDIRGSIGGGINFGVINSTYAGLYTDNGGVNLSTNYNVPISFGISGSEKMRIATNGSVGVGAVPSAWGGVFTAIQGGSYGQHIGFQSNNADMKIGVNNYYNGSGYIYHTTGKAASQLNISADSGLIFSTAGTGTAGNAISFTDRFAITNAGLVRINTSSNLGGGLLGLNGNLEFGGTAGGNYRITNYQAGYLAFDTDNTERMRITSTGTFQFNTSGPGLFTLGAGTSYANISGGGGASLYLNGPSRGGATTAGSGVAVLAADGNIYFTDSSTNTYKVVITNTGNVGVNTSGNVGKFVVADAGVVITSGNVTFDSQAKGIELYNTTSGTTDNLIGYWFSTGPHKSGIATGRTNAGAGWEVDLRFFVHDSSTTNLNNCYERMRLYGGGNLTINGSLTQNGSLSDLTLKENLVKILNPLDKVSQISGYTFTWKENAPARQHISNIIDDAGLIAQEVEEILPEIVRQNEDGTKALNYNGVTGLLIEAIKELKAENDTLKEILQRNNIQ
jgi:hypothetical protein